MMMNKIFIILLGLMLFSCSDDEDLKTPHMVPPYSSENFPIDVGNYWVYEVEHQNENELETLKLEVIDTVGSAKFFCTISSNNNLLDTSYITLSDDSLVYEEVNQAIIFIPNFRLKFPFAVGDQWAGNYGNDTLTVDSILDEVIVAGNSYENVYSIKRDVQILAPGSILEHSFKIAPNIGVITQDIRSFNDVQFQDKKLKLIDINLN